MLLITNNGASAPILESNYIKDQSMNGENFSISFTSYDLGTGEGYNLIDFNVLVEDEDGHEYKVKQLVKKPKTKEVVATHIFYELSGSYKHDFLIGNRSLDEFLDWLLVNTGWNFENLDVNGFLSINSFGNNNVLQLIQTLLNAFECELLIMPNKTLRFAKVIGEDNEKQYRFKNNLKEASETIDVSNIKTRVMAYGANGLSVIYTSPLANNQLFGILEAPPIIDESLNNEEDLLNLASKSLNDEPEITIEVSVLDTDGDVGDFVWVIHEQLDLLFRTRILSKQTRRDYEESTVVLGNTKAKDIIDVIVAQKNTIDENEKTTRSRFEQTDDRITLEVERVDESIASLNVRADSIELSVNNTRDELNSRITQTATDIRLEVNNVRDNLQSSIEQNAQQISLRVRETDYNGNNIASLINQTSTTIKLQASRIEFEGEVFGQGATFSGELRTGSDVEVGRNIEMQSSGGGSIRFPNSEASLTSSSTGNLSIESLNNVNITGDTINLNGRARVNGEDIVYSSSGEIELRISGGELRVYLDGSLEGSVTLT